MTKNFHFIMQSKGGAGKSMITYLYGLKHEENKAAVFVDLDKSTRTTIKQLDFLKTKGRLYKGDLQDTSQRIDRERFLRIVENFASMKDVEDLYFDLGAPESEQLPNLFKYDGLSQNDLKEFAESIHAKFDFLIVIAGGGYHSACLNYLVDVAPLLKDSFHVVAYLNEYSYRDNPEHRENALDIINTLGIEYKSFGDFNTDFESGKTILSNVAKGVGLQSYDTFIAKKKIKKAIEEL